MIKFLFIKMFPFLAVCVFGITTLQAQMYNAHDKEALRAFLRQPSTKTGMYNFEVMGLHASDTLNWNTSESWWNRLNNPSIKWNNASPKQLTAVLINSNNTNEPKFAGALNLAGCMALETLNCNENEISSIDVSTCSALQVLGCIYNPLGSINVSGCTALKELMLYNTQLESLDVNPCSSLVTLAVTGGKFTSLDVSNHMALKQLICSDNQLTSLNINGCNALEDLFCTNNQLNSLDVSTCTLLKKLFCNENRFTSLNINTTTHSQLTDLDCSKNQFTFSSLPKIDRSSISYTYNSQEGITGGSVVYSTGIDLSSEHTVTISESLQANTTYRWHDIEGIEAPTSKITDLGNGKFTFDASLAGKTLLCLMYNSLFSNLTIGYDVFILENENSTYYSEHDKEALRNFLRQPSQIPGKYNFQIADLTVSDTLNWYTNELWISYQDFLWNNATPRQIKSAILYDTNYGGELNLVGCTALQLIKCTKNALTSVNISGCTALQSVELTNGTLTTLDVSNTNIEQLDCSNNQLTTLYVNGCTALKSLDCSMNQLQNLDVISCTSLEKLACNNNVLTSLHIDITINTLLTELNCSSNRLQFSTLPKIDPSSISYQYNYQKSVGGGSVVYSTGVDLGSEHTVIINGSLQANTTYSWQEITEEGKIKNVSSQVTDLGNGKFTFDVSLAGRSLLCILNNPIFSKGGFIYDFYILEDESSTYYHAHDKEAIRNFLRQPSQIPGKYNYELLYFTESDTLNWNTSEFWLTPIYQNIAKWNDASPKRIKSVNLKDTNYAGELNLSGCTALDTLVCPENKVTSINVSGCTALQSLLCMYNPLVSLDVNGCTALESLLLFKAELESLDVSSCNALIDLEVGSGILTTLDVSNLSLLETLTCRSNNIASLNVNGCSALTYLNCTNNQIRSIDVSTCTALTSLYCNGNYLTFTTLPENEFTSYAFSSQNSINGGTIVYSEDVADLSSEYSITRNGTTKNTTYTWYNAADNRLVTLNENPKGVFTFEPGMINKAYYCKMTNDNFPGLTIQYNIVVTGEGGIIPVQNIQLNKNILTLTEGTSETLTATILPDNASNNEITWSSKASGIASVDANGKITAVTEGIAYIIATAKDGSKQADSCKVTVVGALISIESITLNKHALTLKKGSSETLTPTILPDNVSNNEVTWSSKAPGIASVDANGKITAVTAGVTYIIATATDGSNKADSCIVTVEGTLVTIEKITLNKHALTLTKGSSETLSLTISPLTIENATIKWESLDTHIATVNSNGDITAMAKGETQIIVTTEDGMFKDTCHVNVIENVGINFVDNNTTVVLYPNPVKEVLYIQTNEAIQSICIYDVNGRMVKQTTKIKESVSVADLLSGVYIVKIRTNAGEIVQRIIKQ